MSSGFTQGGLRRKNHPSVHGQARDIFLLCKDSVPIDTTVKVLPRLASQQRSGRAYQPHSHFKRKQIKNLEHREDEDISSVFLVQIY